MTLRPKEFDELIELVDILTGPIAGLTLESLLKGMSLAFYLSRNAPAVLHLEGYHANIEGFEAVYAFATEEGPVHTTAAFKDGKMLVKGGTPNKWDLRVNFKDVAAFWKFIFSGGKDIIESLLANDVQVYGNLNYLYKFGFMARDLMDRLPLLRMSTAP